MIAALLIYSLALLAFAGDYAFGRPRRRAAMLAAKPAADRAAQLATVGAARGRGARRAGVGRVGIKRGAGTRIERGRSGRGRGRRRCWQPDRRGRAAGA